MLRSKLSSVKPSSLDEFDLDGKPASKTTARTARTTTIGGSRDMIPPFPGNPTRSSSSQLKSRLNSSGGHVLDKKKIIVDPSLNPLNELVQIIYLPNSAGSGPTSSHHTLPSIHPTSTSTSNSTSTSTSKQSPSTQNLPISTLALHTIVDETGKWVKLRLYALVEGGHLIQGTRVRVRVDREGEDGGGGVGGLKRKRMGGEVGMMMTTRRRRGMGRMDVDGSTLIAKSGSTSNSGRKTDSDSGSTYTQDTTIGDQTCKVKLEVQGQDEGLGQSETDDDDDDDDDEDHDNYEIHEGREWMERDETTDNRGGGVGVEVEGRKSSISRLGLGSRTGAGAGPGVKMDSRLNPGLGLGLGVGAGGVGVGVGIWKGYLRLSKLEHPHTPSSIAKSIEQGLVHVIPGTSGRMKGESVVREDDGQVELIVSFPMDPRKELDAIKPLVIPCQSVRGNVGDAGALEGQAGRLVMDEALRGWWDLGCKIITKHNVVSRELCMLQDRRSRPLPSSSTSALGTPASGSQIPSSSQSGARSASQDQRPGMEARKGSGVKTDPNYEDYLALVKEVQALRAENRQLSQENSALKGGYAGKLSLSQQARGGPGSQPIGARQMPPGMSKIQPGIRRPPKIESGFASSSDDD